MSHDYHEGPEDAVLYDGCDECDHRAANPLDGLLTLDGQNMERLLGRVLSVEYGLGPADRYRTGNEARLGHALYRLLVLAERHPEIMQGRLSW
jgi:hypothetical protein